MSPWLGTWTSIFLFHRNIFHGPWHLLLGDGVLTQGWESVGCMGNRNVCKLGLDSV